MRKFFLPILVIMLSYTLNYGQTTAIAPDGSGTEIYPYQITSLNNLSWLAQNDSVWSAYFVQTADIDASETAIWIVLERKVTFLSFLI